MERAYLTEAAGGQRLVHHYGDRVHVLADPLGLSLMARLCHPATVQPGIQRLTEACFRHLFHAVVERLPARVARTETRMGADDPRGVFSGRLIDPSARAVVVDVARGGMIPSYVFQLELLNLLEADGVRVDHVFMQRVTDADGHVTGVDNSGSKIGGPVDDVTLIVPDPMAATGSSMVELLRLYRDEVVGRPANIVLCHLVVTPEYLRAVQACDPDVWVYALRVDRGASPEDVLACVPGERWDDERGLNDHDYILPGAGGVGELLNNAFV